MSKKNIKNLNSVGYSMDTEKMVIYPTNNEENQTPMTDVPDEWILSLSDDDFEVAQEYIDIPFRCLRC